MTLACIQRRSDFGKSAQGDATCSACSSHCLKSSSGKFIHLTCSWQCFWKRTSGFYRKKANFGSAFFLNSTYFSPRSNAVTIRRARRRFMANLLDLISGIYMFRSWLNQITRRTHPCKAACRCHQQISCLVWNQEFLKLCQRKRCWAQSRRRLC